MSKAPEWRMIHWDYEECGMFTLESWIAFVDREWKGSEIKKKRITKEYWDQSKVHGLYNRIDVETKEGD